MNAEKTSRPALAGNPLQSKMQKCISVENLSAELDGEYHFSPDEQVHLAHCPRCRKLYESYRIVDDAVTRSLGVNCPRAACNRIRKNVNRRLDQLAPMSAHEPIRFSALVARVAAVAVIAAMAGYLIFIDNPYSDELEKVCPQPSASAEVRPEQPAADFPNGFSGGVDVRNLRLAATGDSPSIRFLESAAAPVKAENAVLIPNAVKHVWLFDPSWKADSVEKLFRSAVEKSNIPLQNVRISPAEEGAFRARLTLSRYQSVMLTRQLALRNFQLISPVQPQPEQKLFAGTGRETVEYEAVFLPRGNK